MRQTYSRRDMDSDKTSRGEGDMARLSHLWAEQEILASLRRLEPQQVTEVVNFIEFLREKHTREGSPPKHPLLQALRATPAPEVELKELRKRLTSIPGRMSDTVRELRL